MSLNNLFLAAMAPGAMPWTPYFFGSSLALWLDASDAATVTRAGSSVSQWNDKSGNNRHATQSDPSLQPTYLETGLNGKPVLSFDGAGDGFTLAEGVGVPRDMVSVSQGGGYLYSAATNTDRLAYTSGGTNLYWGTAFNSPSNVVIPGRNNTSTFIEQYSAGGADYAWAAYLNGTNAAGGSLGSLWNNSNILTRIGLQFEGLTGISTWSGTIAEIVWTNSVMASPVRQKLEGYLAHKWGLTGSLPADHPYKTDPPYV